MNIECLLDIKITLTAPYNIYKSYALFDLDAYSLKFTAAPHSNSFKMQGSAKGTDMVQLIKKGGLRERANRSRSYKGSENTETTLKPNRYRADEKKEETAAPSSHLNQSEFEVSDTDQA